MLLGSPYILYGKVIEEMGKYFIQRSFEKLVQLKDGKYSFLYNNEEIEITVSNGEYQLPCKIAKPGIKIELNVLRKIDNW